MDLTVANIKIKCIFAAAFNIVLCKVALVVELVDTRDLKSREHCVRAGSSPARGTQAEIAQLVEHNLAKVRVASSSLVFRSHK